MLQLFIFFKFYFLLPFWLTRAASETNWANKGIMAVFLDVLTKTKFEGNKNRSTSPPTKLKLRRMVSVVCRLIKVQCLWEMLICAAFWEESQHEQKTKPTCQEGRQPVGMGLPVVMQREREREKAVWVWHTAGRWRMFEEAAEGLRGNTAAAGWFVANKLALY